MKRDQRHGGPDDNPMVRVNVRALRFARNGKNLSQEKLVEELKDVGCAINIKTYQTAEEKGDCRLSTLKDIAEVLDVAAVDELLALGQDPWTIPGRKWRPGEPPGVLLAAETGAVPFHLRREELLDLQRWCAPDTECPVKVRLYLGRGGMGKTRLALKLCKDMLASGWRAGFVYYDAFHEDPEQWEGILRDKTPLLIVFDYAQYHRGAVQWVLSFIQAHEPPRTRVVLLARNAGEWWSRLKAAKFAGDLLTGAAASVHTLKSLTLSPREREESFRQAVEAFAGLFRKSALPQVYGSLDAPHYDRVLLLHITALAAVEGVRVEGEDSIYDYTLNREERFWEEGLSCYGLPARLFEGVRQAMAAVTYFRGIATREDGVELLRVLPFFEGQTADVLNSVNNMLRDLYPGDAQWIEPVRPDPSGERLIERAFAGNERLRKAVFKVLSQAVKL